MSVRYHFNMTKPLYIILQNIAAEDKYAKLHSLIFGEMQSQTQNIIWKLYFGCLASQVVKSSSPFDRIDPALLWFLNTIGY